jgi:hypothetical protein
MRGVWATRTRRRHAPLCLNPHCSSSCSRFFLCFSFFFVERASRGLSLFYLALGVPILILVVARSMCRQDQLRVVRIVLLLKNTALHNSTEEPMVVEYQANFNEKPGMDVATFANKLHGL